MPYLSENQAKDDQAEDGYEDGYASDTYGYHCPLETLKPMFS
ncbi:MAG: hypothetical protein R2880_07215 [Deinococcales bacterium]